MAELVASKVARAHQVGANLARHIRERVSASSSNRPSETKSLSIIIVVVIVMPMRSAILSEEYTL